MRIRTVILACVAAAFVSAVAPYVYMVQLGISQAPDLKKTNDEIAHLTAPMYPEVIRDLKGDRLTPETLAAQYQGLLPDGTPIEEKEFHDQEEAVSSALAKK